MKYLHFIKAYLSFKSPIFDSVKINKNHNRQRFNFRELLFNISVYKIFADCSLLLSYDYEVHFLSSRLDNIGLLSYTIIFLTILNDIF